MDTKFKAKITFEFEYDVDLTHYGTNNVQKAIEIDKEYALANPLEFVDLINGDTKITVQISNTG